MDFLKLEDFYQVYDRHRTYIRAEVRRKHLRNYDEQFWRPARASAGHSVLELGSGTGLFLAYLVCKGVTDFTGVEQDEKVIDYMPDDIARRVTIGDLWESLDGFERKFNRIVSSTSSNTFPISRAAGCWPGLGTCWTPTTA
ncbi:MAG: class I SAM-dependent methyltransferase [Proteobacteria bacterium]|nr:class I SAM-dependent methyltransferase [Pseudomonadota bacterium]